jgi:acetoin utilization deacetylase AcuC-like enzyme
MKVFYTDFHKSHNPPFEILDGGEKTQSFEVPARVENILEALKETNWADICAPEDFGLDPILAVHDKGYLEFLQTAFEQWTNEQVSYEHLALTPATFPPGGIRRLPKSVLGKAGYYMMDLSAPIGAGTFEAAIQSANCGLSGAKELISGEKAVFGLCRPPGHHSGKVNCGGYCYLNNAAIAANWLGKNGKVVILDIDYHAGNGTQEIFYTRDDILTISIHADPEIEYPYYAGYADEIGEGKGRGFHRNFPLPFETTDDEYLDALADALGIVRKYAPVFLVISLGLDIYTDDPLGKFRITKNGIRHIGKSIAGIGTPTLAVMEGGYNLQELGENVVEFLSAFVMEK